MTRRHTLLAALLLMVASCGMTWVKQDPDAPDNGKVIALRVPGGSPGSACAQECNGHYQTCLNGLTSEGTCNQRTISCYNRCPGVSTGYAMGNSGAACMDKLAPDQPVTCFAYWPDHPYHPGVYH